MKNNQKAMFALLLCTGFVATPPLSVLAHVTDLLVASVQQKKPFEKNPHRRDATGIRLYVEENRTMCLRMMRVVLDGPPRDEQAAAIRSECHLHVLRVFHRQWLELQFAALSVGIAVDDSGGFRSTIFMYSRT